MEEKLNEYTILVGIPDGEISTGVVWTAFIRLRVETSGGLF
jgi:hypothetical protein